MTKEAYTLTVTTGTTNARNAFTWADYPKDVLTQTGEDTYTFECEDSEEFDQANAEFLELARRNRNNFEYVIRNSEGTLCASSAEEF